MSAGHRFYENQFPEPDDLVRVKILGKEEHGFRCILLEYNNLEGLVLLNELKRGRVRSYHKILKKQKEYTVLVLRVHQQTSKDGTVSGFIDLSLKAVPRDALPSARDKWEKGKTVAGVIDRVHHVCKISRKELYENFIWKLAKKHKTAYIGLKKIMDLADKEAIQKRMLEEGVPEKCLDALYKELDKRMQPSPENITAEIAMNCYSKHGIEGIQHALAVGIKCSTPELQLVFRIVAAPLFEVCVTTLESEKGVLLINETIKKMKIALESKDGTLTVKHAPQIRDAVEDDIAELQRIEKLDDDASNDLG